MNDSEVSDNVADPARLAALRGVAVLDTPTEESFDRLTWLAAHFLGTPVALVSLIDADRQFFKSSLGLPEPWRSRREMPLSLSFCKYNLTNRRPLLVEDARTHPLFRDHPAIRDLNVIAYLGIPLVTSDGYTLGSFCVIDSKPRQWTNEDVTVIESLASSVMVEIQLRTEVAIRKEAEESLATQKEELLKAHQDLQKKTAECLRVLEQLRQRDEMLIQQNRLAAMGEMIGNIAHQWRQPLNLLALLAQELPMTYKSDRFNTEYLESNVKRMMAHIGFMSKTIDDFRNFFRPDRAKMDFSIREMVEKTVSFLNVTLRERRVKLAVFPTYSPVVNGYANEYSQVLLNIIINAMDAFVIQKVSSPLITIEIGTDEGRSVVTITDNGGGICEDIINKIFDPYFTTKGPNGTGIGLYMSKMIIETNMGGSLSVRNVHGGAQFRIVV